MAFVRPHKAGCSRGPLQREAPTRPERGTSCEGRQRLCPRAPGPAASLGRPAGASRAADAEGVAGGRRTAVLALGGSDVVPGRDDGWRTGTDAGERRCDRGPARSAPPCSSSVFSLTEKVTLRPDHTEPEGRVPLESDVHQLE